MAPLPRPFSRHLLEEDALPLDEDALEILATLSTRDLRAVVSRALDLLPDGFGAHLLEHGLARSEIGAPLSAAALRSDPGFSAILEGQRRLSRGASDRALVGLCQRAMQAVAGRVDGAPAKLALAGFGVDHDFGREFMAANDALIAWKKTGGDASVFGKAEARALLELLEQHPTPDLFAAPAPAPEVLPGAGAARIAKIARSIAEAVSAPYRQRLDGRSYEYTAGMFGVEPSVRPPKGLLKSPGGVAYSIREGYGFWKCNVFGGTVLGLADVPVPTFRVGRFRHYPRAERFGPALVRKRGWEMVRALDHRDPADPTRAVKGPTQDAEIRDLLARAQPGDLCFVDHPGEPGEDGGHTRVCVEAVAPDDRGKEDAPLWAQASSDRALLRRDGMRAMAGGKELQLWLCRYTG
ncbi:MAG: hypothetical protein KC636_03295 [Myxococcales bacterium]|nr:hypothetical protein [Myxococcales bacterium]